jgi:hypothetical protein
MMEEEEEEGRGILMGSTRNEKAVQEEVGVNRKIRTAQKERKMEMIFSVVFDWLFASNLIM